MLVFISFVDLFAYFYFKPDLHLRNHDKSESQPELVDFLLKKERQDDRVTRENASKTNTYTNNGERLPWKL